MMGIASNEITLCQSGLSDWQRVIGVHGEIGGRGVPEIKPRSNGGQAV
jgi:hypothetical protein